jgi:hypothetical protein
MEKMTVRDQQFQEEISVVSWEEVINEKENASMAFDTFLKILSPIYDKCCPVEVVRKKKNVQGNRG